MENKINVKLQDKHEGRGDKEDFRKEINSNQGQKRKDS